MYLLDCDEPAAVEQLKRDLAPLGDSLVVVGAEGLWNVHVHVDDVGAAIEAGITAGRPHRIRVTHFAEQVEAAAQRAEERAGRRIVAVAAGPGLARLFGDAGAIVIEGAPGRRPSTGMLLEAVVGSGAAEIVILPNDPDSVRAAQIAARTAEEDHAVRVAVIPTEAQVQGLARPRRPRAGPYLRRRRARDDRDRAPHPPRRGDDRGEAGDDDGRSLRAR